MASIHHALLLLDRSLAELHQLRHEALAAVRDVHTAGQIEARNRLRLKGIATRLQHVGRAIHHLRRSADLRESRLHSLPRGKRHGERQSLGASRDAADRLAERVREVLAAAQALDDTVHRPWTRSQALAQMVSEAYGLREHQEELLDLGQRVLRTQVSSQPRYEPAVVVPPPGASLADLGLMLLVTAAVLLGRRKR